MAVSAIAGPQIVAGQIGSDSNADIGPSLFYGTAGLLDSRFAYQQNTYAKRAVGYAGGYLETLDAVPAALAANNIAASQTPTAGTPLTLVTTTGAGVTVLSAATVGLASGLAIASGTLALDGAPAVHTGGSNQAIQWYQASTMLSRAVRIVSAGNDSSATFTVAGYDEYGYAMSEAIAGANGTATGKKALKFITSVTPSGTLSGSAVTVGTTDVIGFPLFSDRFGKILIFFNDALITATTGYVAGVTSTATTTTGDTRGTYLLQSASDGVKTLLFMQMVTPGMVATQPSSMWGVTQA